MQAAPWWLYGPPEQVRLGSSHTAIALREYEQAFGLRKCPHYKLLNARPPTKSCG